jgi:hypothetical protein
LAETSLGHDILLDFEDTALDHGSVFIIVYDTVDDLWVDVLGFFWAAAYFEFWFFWLLGAVRTDSIACVFLLHCVVVVGWGLERL